MSKKSNVRYGAEPKKYLPKKVAEALREHVPEELSIMMRERLEHADHVLVLNEVLEAENQRLEAEITEHGTLVAARKKAKADQANAFTAIATSEKISRDLSVARLEIELAAERRISATFEGALAGMVRNIEWRERVEIGREHMETLAVPQTKTNSAE